MLLALSGKSRAQEQPDDTTPEPEPTPEQGVVITVQAPADTLYLSDGTRAVRSISIKNFGHSPHTATMYAAILPGLGQIYNKKYWKLPFIYGGTAALCYAVHFNGKYYKRYREAYRDFVIRDPNNKSYAKVLRHSNLTVEDVEERYETWFTKILSNKKDYYRRYRDMSYFGLIGVYLVQLIDATVDAHFHNFDISDDLSFHWQPTITPLDYGAQMGATLIITF